MNTTAKTLIARSAEANQLGQDELAKGLARLAINNAKRHGGEAGRRQAADDEALAAADALAALAAAGVSLRATKKAVKQPEVTASVTKQAATKQTATKQTATK